MIVQRKGEWLSANVGDEVVMMSVETGNYIGLNPMAVQIWAMIELPMTFEAICAQLLDEFDVTPEVCREEVQAFLDTLERHGAVEFSPRTPA